MSVSACSEEEIVTDWRVSSRVRGRGEELRTRSALGGTVLIEKSAAHVLPPRVAGVVVVASVHAGNPRFVSGKRPQGEVLEPGADEGWRSSRRTVASVHPEADCSQ